jgi:hypothetical protein
LFYDDLTAPAPGKAKLRFVHLAPTVPSVDVAYQNGTGLFTNVSYGRAGGSVLAGERFNAFSLGPFSTVDAGTVRLVVKQHQSGEELSLSGNPFGALSLEAGKIYTIYLNGAGAASLGGAVIVHN